MVMVDVVLWTEWVWVGLSAGRARVGVGERGAPKVYNPRTQACGRAGCALVSLCGTGRRAGGQGSRGRLVWAVSAARGAGLSLAASRA